MSNSILDYRYEYKKRLSLSYTKWTYNLTMDMGENIISQRCIVTGKVQGVFFRASTREQALKLNIMGYAKNLSNGDVEVVAYGDTDAVEKLKKWLLIGPKYAEVKNIECKILNLQQIENIDLNNFKVL